MALAFESTSMSDFLLFDDERHSAQQPSNSAAQPTYLQSPIIEQHHQHNLLQQQHEDSLVKQDLDFSSLLSSDLSSAPQPLYTEEDFAKSTAPESMAYYAPYYATDIPRALSFDAHAQNVMMQPAAFYNPMQQPAQNSFPVPSTPSSPSTSAEMFEFSAHSSVGSAPSVPSSDRGSPFSAAEEWPLNNVEDVNVSIYNGEYTSWPGLPQPWEQQSEVPKAEGFVGECAVTPCDDSTRYNNRNGASIANGSIFSDPHLINTNLSRATSRHASVDLSASPRIARRNTLRHSPYPPSAQLSRTSSIVSSKGSPSHSYIEDISFPEAFVGSTPMNRDQSMNKHRRTVSSASSPASSMSGSSTVMAPNANNRDSLCLDCNKVFRDLRAHQLTHLKERPEKCPIASCEYSKKGFARKYDCQRHTLTHYKGTMVCGFCPGSGLATEKTFNRADVFKRHLMSVHNVEQTPPNGRSKKTAPVPNRSSSIQNIDGGAPRSSTSPTSSTFPAFTKGADGKCSTCGVTFLNAQQFYEHLDDCVLHKVTEAEPAGAINESNLDQVKLEDIQATLAEHGLLDVSAEDNIEEDEDEDDEEDKNLPTGIRAGGRKNVTGRKGSGVAGR